MRSSRPTRRNLDENIAGLFNKDVAGHVADAVTYLASASWVTGVILPVDGGVNAGGDGSDHGLYQSVAQSAA